MERPGLGRGAASAGAGVMLGGSDTGFIPHSAHPLQPASDPRLRPDWASAWRAAGDDFGRRLDDAGRTRARGGLDLRTLALIALDHDNLAHVMGKLGFTHSEAELPLRETGAHDALHPRLRCDAEWWPEPDGPIAIFSGAEVGHVAVDLGSGAWRALPLGGARGLDLIELAALRLGLSRWKAAVALARMCGLADVPEVRAR